MTYEQCFQAMAGLGTHPALHMRSPGAWYVLLPCVEIKDNNILASTGCSGTSPSDAIERTWVQLVTLREPKRLVIHAMNSDRREVKWNGFMWEDIPK